MAAIENTDQSRPDDQREREQAKRVACLDAAERLDLHQPRPAPQSPQHQRGRQRDQRNARSGRAADATGRCAGPLPSATAATNDRHARPAGSAPGHNTASATTTPKPAEIQNPARHPHCSTTKASGLDDSSMPILPIDRMMPGPQAEPRRRHLLCGQRHRAHQHARVGDAEQELSEQKTLRPGGEAGRQRADDGSNQQTEGNRPHAKTIHRGADRNLRGGERKMIDRGQARQRLRRCFEIGRHHVEADGRDRPQQRRQHVAAGQRQKRKNQCADVDIRVIGLAPSMNRLAPKLLRRGNTNTAGTPNPACPRRSVLVEHQCPQLDAFARGGVGGRGRIDEGGMRPEPRAAVGCGIVALQQQRLVGRISGM